MDGIFSTRLYLYSLKQFILAIVLILLLNASSVLANASYKLFESAPVRTLAISADGERLFALNTPDNHLEIFDIRPAGLFKTASVPVGIEPVALAVRNNNEVWVVNHISDSVSIVDVSSAPRLVQTLQVGDEPRDIVFAGNNRNRVFITTAHRGQSSPYTDPVNPGQMTTPGIGRADIWVFDAAISDNKVNGSPLSILTLEGDTPRSLAVSPNGSKIYAGIFNSGNQTTSIHARAVCDGGALELPCVPVLGELSAPGGLPAPNLNIESIEQPEVGLIVKYRDGRWKDELNRDWSNMVRFDLPDNDVFMINAISTPPVVIDSFSHVGTTLFDIAVNPVNGKLYVTNTDAQNEVRFEGVRPTNSPVSSVIGHISESRISVIDSKGVHPRHLNKHINYDEVPSPAGTKQKSLALPLSMTISADGKKLYLTAYGSSKVAFLDISALEDNSFQPDQNQHVTVSGGGPNGIVLDEGRGYLYVSTRFDNGISVIDIGTRTEVEHILLHNPEPDTVKNGRQFLYDASLTSSNGEASCASCHIFGDMDMLAWDLGNPLDTARVNNNPGIQVEPASLFHPMKGPMTTQSLRGLESQGPMHWRGDRSAGDNGGDPLDEEAAFKKFNGAFVQLLGRESELSVEQMQQFTDFTLQITYPPNPIRSLDNSLTAMQHEGRDFFLGGLGSTLNGQSFTCVSCHEINRSLGFFGSNGLTSFINAPQDIKIPQLRNMYQKVGMFGMPSVDNITDRDNAHMGDQIRGFGFFHDGSVDTLSRFHSDVIFTSETHDNRDVLEQFILGFESNMAPVVGQQRTMNLINEDVINTQINFLLGRSDIGDCEIIVQAHLNGELKRALRVMEGPDKGKFQTDSIKEPLYLAESLNSAVLDSGAAITYSCVPNGSGFRMALDRDEDGHLNRDDNCPETANADQQDVNGDGRGDICEVTEYPWPSIEANGSGQPLIIKQSEMLNISISARSGDFTDKAADWWISLDSPVGSFWWVVGEGWIKSDTPVRAYDGVLLDFGPFTLLNQPGLPVGIYSFKFALDDEVDGIYSGVVVDKVSVEIKID